MPQKQECYRKPYLGIPDAVSLRSVVTLRGDSDIHWSGRYRQRRGDHPRVYHGSRALAVAVER